MGNRVKIALVYDFDGTLSPGNMQEYDFIPAVGKHNEEFWTQSNRLAEEQDADPILVYMWKMIHDAQGSDVSIRRESFVGSGRNIKLYEGVEEWFARINAYGAAAGLEVEHYINSSGIKEMIEGTPIAHEFKKIYACSFLYDVNGVACWPAVSVNFTNKTQFIFKINKGIESVYESKLINKFVPEEQRPVQFKHIIYVGDGTTDIPCMKLVKDKGGHSIAVYDPASGDEKRKHIGSLIEDNRVSYVCSADYREGGKMDALVKAIIDKIGSDLKLDGYVER